jgi:ABC-type sugar transport system ATPase subunit
MAERPTAASPADRGRTTSPVRLLGRGLTKRYGAQVALRNVDFDVRAGEAVAVVGENGAGKSTLSKIVSGTIRPDSGELSLDGVSLSLSSPRDALRVGISYIPQELAYLPNRSVADNLLVGRWPSRFGLTSRPFVEREAARLADRFGIRLDVRRALADLPLAERQLAEILKALARDVKVLVLDEPTASLTAGESRNLFRVLRTLQRESVGVVFISHRLDEVFEIADRIVVLRNGVVVADVPTEGTTPEQLIEYMLGVAVARAEFAAMDEDAGEPGAAPLRVRGWNRVGLPNIAQLSFDVRAGEVLGLFGQRGSGADLVADGLGGRVGDFAGDLELRGRLRKPFTTPREARKERVAYVPPERKRDGLVLGQSVGANLSMLVLGRVSRFGLIRRLLERREAQAWRKQLQIHCQAVTQPVESLSGGNQQKVLLGSRLAMHPDILILNEPTRGVDVGARAEIHRYLRDEAARGTAVMWVTSDVEEAVLVSDRLLVMRDGVLVGQLKGDAKTQSAALALATGERQRTEAA